MGDLSPSASTALGWTGAIGPPGACGQRITRPVARKSIALGLARNPAEFAGKPSSVENLADSLKLRSADRLAAVFVRFCAVVALMGPQRESRTNIGASNAGN